MAEETAHWGGAPDVRGPAIVTIGPVPDAAARGIAAQGGWVRTALAWDGLDAAWADGVFADALLVAVAPADIGHGALERFATLAEGTTAVVGFEAEALDAVAAALMGSGVELVCDASALDWSLALALAMHGRAGVPGGVREGRDSDRLRRMNEEVARIASLLSGLVLEPTSIGVDGAVDDRRRSYGEVSPTDESVTAAEVRRTIRARRMRAQVCDPRLLEDPGWDMLLDLFAAELEDMRVSVSSLCIAAAVAPTTALRWITRMAGAGLMERVADPGDRRRAFVALTQRASAAMRSYVTAVKRAGLPLV